MANLWRFSMWRRLFMIDGKIKGDGTSRKLKAIDNLIEQYPTYESFATALSSGELTVDVLFNALGWDEIPTFLNTDTLLKSFTANFIGLTGTSVDTVDEAFMALAIGVGKYAFRITLYMPDGVTPLVGATLSGLTAFSGMSLKSDENGQVFGYSSSKTPTISIADTGFFDLVGKSKQLNAVSKITYDSINAIKRTDANKVTIYSSTTGKFSSLVDSVDVCAVGPGGGGGGGGMSSGKLTPGGGGGGGQVVNRFKISVATNRAFSVSIGGGGSGGLYTNDGKDGGTTSVSIGNSVVTAQGGKGGKTGNNAGTGGSGGSGWGAGGTGNDQSAGGGVSNSTYLFNESALGLPGGGGGGGGSNSGAEIHRGLGGGPYGGKGALQNADAEKGNGPGGGGGGGAGIGDNSRQVGGSGYSGRVYFRLHFIDEE